MKNVFKLFALLFLFSSVTLASDLTLGMGLEAGSSKIAHCTCAPGATFLQQSHVGPAADIELQVKRWFGELNYVNTNSRLADFNVNTWTLNRFSADTGIEQQFGKRRVIPFVKAGIGVMIIASGRAQDPAQTLVGEDARFEALVGGGIRLRLTKRVSFMAGYEGRIIRNPDFTDHTWKPQRNFLSEPKIGFTYHF